MTDAERLRFNLSKLYPLKEFKDLVYMLYCMNGCQAYSSVPNAFEDGSKAVILDLIASLEEVDKFAFPTILRAGLIADGDDNAN